MTFYKTSSFGNDFIVIAENELACPQGRRPLGGRPGPRVDKCLLARDICDAHRAVGADGVVFYSPGRKAGVPLRDRPRHDGFNFQIHNRDGSEAELSGNGMAGLAAVLLQRRLAASPLTLHSAVGPRRVELLSRRGPLFQLNVEIGRPDFSNRDFFPFLKPGRVSWAIDGLEFHPVAVGNPHAVVLCRERTDPGQLAALGEKLESHPLFPRRVNVEFVYFSDAENPPAGTAALRPASCRVFFYERGVGPTQASSTGSAAVFAVLRQLGLVRDRLRVDCGADQIAVSWNQGIFIHNFTRLVCRGEYFH